MAKAVGRLTLPEKRQDDLRLMLMRRYEGNSDFHEDWVRVLYPHFPDAGRNYNRLIRALLKVTHRRGNVTDAQEEQTWDALGAAIESGPVNTKVGGERQVFTGGREYRIRHHLRLYRQELMDLCYRWGLRCDWAPAWLHARFLEFVDRRPARLTVVPLARTYARWWEDAFIRLEVPFTPWDDWERLEGFILQDVRRQRDLIRSRYVQAGFRLQDKETSLHLHIAWLYLAICPRPDTGKPLGWSGIKELIKKWGSKYEYVTPSAIQKAVEPLAAELGIELPELKSGQPSKY